MSLLHELERSGNWLFRRSSWLPVTLLIPVALYLLFIANRSVIYFNYTWEIVCIVVSACGVLLRGYSAGYSPGRISGRHLIEQVGDELNTSGIYSVMRHPVYAGNFLMWLGPILFLRSVWWVILYLLLFWLYYERIIFAEEQYLRRRFGDAYDTWAFRVRAVIPSFRRYIKPVAPFSFRKLFRREYHGVARLFIVFAFLDLCRNITVAGKFYIEPLYVTLLVAALIFWAVIRYMVRRTKFLDDN